MFLKVWICLENARHLLRSIAVGGEEMAGEALVGELHLRTNDSELRNKSAHPVLRTRGDNDDISALLLCPSESVVKLLPEYMTMPVSKLLAESIELCLWHPAKAMLKQTLLGALIGIAVHEHRHEPRQYAQQGKYETESASLVDDDRHHRVGSCQRTVKV